MHRAISFTEHHGIIAVAADSLERQPEPPRWYSEPRSHDDKDAIDVMSASQQIAWSACSYLPKTFNLEATNRGIAERGGALLGVLPVTLFRMSQ